MLQEIHSKDNQHIKLAASLQKKKTRDELKLFLIEGKTLLEEALKKKQKIKHVFFTKETCYQEFKQNLRPDIDCFLVDETLMTKMSSTESPPPVIAIVEKIEKTNSLEGKFFLYGDDISDPGNLGSIIRTAFAAGVNKIFLSSNSCDIYNPKTLRSSVGAIFYGDIEYTDLGKLVTELKNHASQENKNLKIIGTSSHSKQSLFGTNFDRDGIYLVLLGSEANGLSEKAIQICTDLVSIPLQNNIESINVLAAASVILFEVSRQTVVCHPEGAQRP